MKIVLLTLLGSFLLHGYASAATVADDALTEFVPGSTAKAAEVNANFNALKEAINLSHEENANHKHDEDYYPKSEVDSKVTTLDNKINATQNSLNSHNHDSSYYTQTQVDNTFLKKEDVVTGGNYIPNATFEAGMMGWDIVESLSKGSPHLVDTPNGSAGEKALENDANSVVWGTSTNWITIDRKMTYYVSGSFKRDAVGSVGDAILVVRLRTADGSEIDGTATGGSKGDLWFYPSSLVRPPADQWTHFRKQFGNGTNHPFPDDARYATIAFVLNYDTNNAAGNSIYQVQGLAIHDAVDNKCGENMASYGNGCISEVQTAELFYDGQDTCRKTFKGSICMYNELQRACATGVISSPGPTGMWMGDKGGDDDMYFRTNENICKSNIDDKTFNAISSAISASFRCCR